jgi:NMD protein affecting ribosome stability and mRNA decay
MDREGGREIDRPETWGLCPRCGEKARDTTIAIPGAYVSHSCHVCGCEWIEDKIEGVG